MRRVTIPNPEPVEDILECVEDAPGAHEALLVLEDLIEMDPKTAFKAVYNARKKVRKHLERQNICPDCEGRLVYDEWSNDREILQRCDCED